MEHIFFYTNEFFRYSNEDKFYTFFYIYFIYFFFFSQNISQSYLITQPKSHSLRTMCICMYMSFNFKELVILMDIKIAEQSAICE